MNAKTNPGCSEGCSRQPALSASASASASCIICSLTPLSNPIASSCGEVFCSLPCLRRALIEKHQDGHQESRHEGDHPDVDSADHVAIDQDVEVLVQKERSETLCEQIKQLQQLEDNLEQLKTTVVCALGLESVEDQAWIDEAIAKERLETQREIAWLERGTLRRL